MTKVTPQVLGLTKTTDANGWSVYDYGAFKVYKKRVTFASQSISTAPTGFTLASTNLPVGVSNLSVHYIDYTVTSPSFAGALNVVYEGSTSSTGLNFTATSADTTRSYSGFVDVTITS